MRLLVSALMIAAATSVYPVATATGRVAKPAPAAPQNEPDALPAAQAIPPMTQRLLDALPHDRTPWQRYLSDRAVYVSEAGVVATKSELLEGFAPFPEGLSGSISCRTLASPSSATWRSACSMRTSARRCTTSTSR